MVFRCADGRIDWIMSGIMTVITALVLAAIMQSNKNAIETAELKVKVANIEKGVDEIRSDVKYLVRNKKENE